MLSKQQIIRELKQEILNGNNNANDIFINITQKHRYDFKNENEISEMIGLVATTIVEYINLTNESYDYAMKIIE